MNSGKPHLQEFLNLRLALSEIQKV